MPIAGSIPDRDSTSVYNRALVLYVLGRYEEAEEELTSLIEISPSGAGQRYFLRALARIQLGKMEEAEQDLMIGSGNTWIHTGMLPYAAAKLALSEGDKEAALQLMQYAEASYHNARSPILDAIREELTALDVFPPGRYTITSNGHHRPDPKHCRHTPPDRSLDPPQLWKCELLGNTRCGPVRYRL